MTPRGAYRIGIVGAASIAGKELSEALAESPLAACKVTLLDDEAVAGRITTAGDEPAFLQKLEADSFSRLDFVFFVGDATLTRKFWKTARQAGASIIDMTYGLEGEAGVVVRAPWLEEATKSGWDTQRLDLTVPAVIAAHPAALMLELVSARLRAKYPVRALSATVFEPASEHGQAAMDELHRQTVSLMSFQSLPRELYDAQVAFNLVPALGVAAKVKLEETRRRILAHAKAIGPAGPPEIRLQLIQAPVFHGYTASVLVELQAVCTASELAAAVRGEHVDVVTAESDPPSNQSAAGQPDILMRVNAGNGEESASNQFWLWMAADNLRLAALNAIACAEELRQLRPQGSVQ